MIASIEASNSKLAGLQEEILKLPRAQRKELKAKAEALEEEIKLEKQELDTLNELEAELEAIEKTSLYLDLDLDLDLEEANEKTSGSKEVPMKVEEPAAAAVVAETTTLEEPAAAAMEEPTASVDGSNVSSHPSIEKTSLYLDLEVDGSNVSSHPSPSFPFSYPFKKELLERNQERSEESVVVAVVKTVTGSSVEAVAVDKIAEVDEAFNSSNKAQEVEVKVELSLKKKQAKTSQEAEDAKAEGDVTQTLQGGIRVADVKRDLNDEMTEADVNEKDIEALEKKLLESEGKYSKQAEENLKLKEKVRSQKGAIANTEQQKRALQQMKYIMMNWMTGLQGVSLHAMQSAHQASKADVLLRQEKVKAARAVNRSLSD